VEKNIKKTLENVKKPDLNKKRKKRLLYLWFLQYLYVQRCRNAVRTPAWRECRWVVVMCLVVFSSIYVFNSGICIYMYNVVEMLSERQCEGNAAE